jgi:hypothetical protein
MNASRFAADWDVLGVGEVEGLADARRQLHHAAQVIVSAPISYLSPRADDSHTNLEWFPGLRVLATNSIDGEARLRFALRPSDLALLTLRADVVQSVLALAGRSLADAVTWLAGELSKAGQDPDRLTTRKHYEIPPHPVVGGAQFGAAPGALAELARWYHNAWLVAATIAEAAPGASPPRCWPHHFDLATLITLPASADGVTRTIGVGGSPGDDSYPEPYLYVGPYPHPAAASLPPLRHGRWHTTGWVGAVRRRSDIASRPDATAQRDDALAFAREAVAACRRLLTTG